MCGIAGFAGFGSAQDLEAMTAALSHRGPDGSGLWIAPDAPVFLGHRRLSIVDLEGGAQPMWDATGDVGVTYNGEIYNHLELRRELEAAGHRFRTSHSDTEVLIHGYREWGESLPKRLNGMFAFAIFDRVRRRLFLARDRFGEKPLYVYRRPGRLAFASELSSLLCHADIAPDLDPRALQKLFAWGFVPTPNALYRHCRKVPGGTSLIYSIADDTLLEHRYWKFRLEPDPSLTDHDVPRLAEELKALFAQAVKRRLMSDVPLGLFLSGGIDSGGTLAAAAQTLPADRILTFTIGFNEESYDESPYARELAEHFGVRHHEQLLDLDKARELLPSVLLRLDEPLGDASIVPTFLLSRFARQSVKVALAGDGGDELFAGYDPFKALTPALIYARLVPKGLHRGLRRLADLIPLSTRNMSFDFKLRRTLAGLSWPAAYWNPVWLAPADPQTIREIFETPLSADELYEEALDLWGGSSGDLLDKTLEFYTNFYLQDDILAKVDRASMMVSLESRAVFLDNDLVEFCRRLPGRFKLRHGRRKWLLKQALRDWLPAKTIGRRKKGFGIPLAKWLRQWPPPVTPDGDDLLFKTQNLQQRWSRHAQGHTDDRLLLFTWLAFISHSGGRGSVARSNGHAPMPPAPAGAPRDGVHCGNPVGTG
jgi:asparagine synthase (glutamine-hydrolysing)